MNTYRVLLAFLTYEVDDLIKLTPQQAKYLLTAGLITGYCNVLLRAVTQTGTGNTLQINACSIQATLTGSGAIAATVIIEHTNDLIAWLTEQTLNLSGSNMVADGYICEQGWAYRRARLTAISGSGATLTVAGLPG